MSMLCLLGIINSRLISFVYPYISNKIITATLPRLAVGDVKKLPIPNIDFSKARNKQLHERIVGLVKQALQLNERYNASTKSLDSTVVVRQISAVDHQIDNLVYELYGLTKEEIRIVEESSEVQ